MLVACGDGTPVEDGAEKSLESDVANARKVACGTVLTEDTRLTADIGPCEGDGVVLAEDGVELDCAGFAIRGSEAGVGVRADGVDDIEIRNCRIARFEQHILLEEVDGGQVEDNTLRGPLGSTGAPNCITLQSSDDIRVEDNRLLECRVLLESSDHNDIIGNRIVDGDLSLALFRSHDNLVAANTIRRCVENSLIQSRDNEFSYNLVVGCQSGFLLEEEVFGNLFLENELRRNDRAFFVLGSGGNDFDDNDLFDNQIGFRLRDTVGGWYANNEVRGNGIGFSLSDADDNEFVRNDVTDNTGDGFEIVDSDVNLFVENESDRNGGAGFRLVNSHDNDFDDTEACDNEAGDLVIVGSFGNDVDDNTFCTTKGL